MVQKTQVQAHHLQVCLGKTPKELWPDIVASNEVEEAQSSLPTSGHAAALHAMVGGVCDQTATKRKEQIFFYLPPSRPPDCLWIFLEGAG